MLSTMDAKYKGKIYIAEYMQATDYILSPLKRKPTYMGFQKLRVSDNRCHIFYTSMLLFNGADCSELVIYMFCKVYIIFFL